MKIASLACRHLLIWGSLPLFALVLAASTVSGADKAAALVNGTDLKAWRPPTGGWTVAQRVALNPTNAEAFVITPGQGIIVNGQGGRTADLVSQREFGDLQLHVEFCIPRHSNSGVYLMGRYEVQVYDSFGVAKDKYPGIECGGIYPRWINERNVEGHSPGTNVSKAPGEWQSFDITFRAPRFDSTGRKTANARLVKVVHNGTVIHQNVELTGPTRGPIAEDEKATGPLRLQGDHGPVAYRNITAQPLEIP